MSGLLIDAYKLQDINLCQSLCVYEYSHMQSKKKLLSNNEKKKEEEKAETHQLCFFLHPSVTANTSCQEEKAEWMRENVLNLQREILHQGREISSSRYHKVSQ